MEKIKRGGSDLWTMDGEEHTQRLGPIDTEAWTDRPRGYRTDKDGQHIEQQQARTHGDGDDTMLTHVKSKATPS